MIHYVDCNKRSFCNNVLETYRHLFLFDRYKVRSYGEALEK